MKKRSFPAGYCFAYCSNGRCGKAKCSFIHLCPTCKGDHAMSQCTRKYLAFSAPQVTTTRLLQLLSESKYQPLLTKDIWQGFTEGFRINFQGDLTHRATPCNHPSLLENLSVAKEMLHKELALGRIAGPFTSIPFYNLVVSPLGLIPKTQPGKFRIIHDLSFPKGDSVNSGIPQEFCSVTYEDYDYFVSLLTSVGRGCFIAKADI